MVVMVMNATHTESKSSKFGFSRSSKVWNANTYKRNARNIISETSKDAPLFQGSHRRNRFAICWGDIIIEWRPVNRALVIDDNRHRIAARNTVHNDRMFLSLTTGTINYALTQSQNYPLIRNLPEPWMVWYRVPLLATCHRIAASDRRS